jgi:hypothetical protein
MISVKSKQGRIQDFKLGGAHLKKLRRAEGGAKMFGVFRDKSRFYAKKSYFFQLRREAQKFLGYFVWKIMILRQKIIFCSNFRGGGGVRTGCAPTPGSAPGKANVILFGIPESEEGDT